MPFLYWKVIQLGKQLGADNVDLGRSSLEDAGLIAFKEHLGAVPSELKYYRHPSARTRDRVKFSWAREAFPRLPEPLLIGAGKLLYRHLG
jgi:hypothetical protein